MRIRIVIFILLGLVGVPLVVFGFATYSADVTITTAAGSAWCGSSGNRGDRSSACDSAINSHKVTSLLLGGLGVLAVIGAVTAGARPLKESLTA